MNISKFLKKYKAWIVLILFVLYWFVFRRFSEFLSIRFSDLFIALLFFIYIGSMGFIEHLKYNSPQIQGAVFHASLGCEPIAFNEGGLDYYLFRLGGYRFNFMYSLGDEGVLVVPKSYVLNQGGEYCFNALVEEVDIEELPQIAINQIKFLKLKPPFYYCLIPSHWAGADKLDLPDSEDMYNTFSCVMRSLNRTIDEYKEILANKRDLVKSQVSDASLFAKSFEKAPPPAPPQEKQ